MPRRRRPRRRPEHVVILGTGQTIGGRHTLEHIVSETQREQREQPAPLSPERLAAIRKRADAATGGPWKCLSPLQAIVLAGLRQDGTPDKDGATDTIGLMVGPTSGATCVVSITALAEYPDRDDVKNDPLWVDADFIAHARTDIPDLLADLTAARAALIAIDGHPTPVDQNGRCWYCGGGLGLGPDGHRETCPLVAARTLAGAAESEVSR